ncbi:4'-phosphopantetheinyl transferase superfamily protein [Conexibacter sp. DBS9H8]|uniref:4'-phosphopantetheinyl transferase family protein n=1 Tax=Conexibacter sp. DBS9H8 TaxID=2937801 RepID=UPI0020108AE4|nr:4'-phosphopantetheinyl transferase superfamily protein [Conexibacter sp. DBS9H8]
MCAAAEPVVTLLRGGRAEARRASPPGRRVSRSYSAPYALVAVHDGPVGVDIEAVGPLEPGFWASICTPSERAALSGADARAITSLWSSKEALAKALGDAVAYDPRRLESPRFWPGGASGRWRARPLDLPDGFVGWVCWALPGEGGDGDRAEPGLRSLEGVLADADMPGRGPEPV